MTCAIFTIFFFPLSISMFQQWQLIDRYVIFRLELIHITACIKSADKQTVGEGEHIIFQWLRKYLRLHGIEWSTALLSSAEAREALRNTYIRCSCTHHIKTRSSLKLDIHYGFHHLPSTHRSPLSLSREPGASAADRKCTWKESSGGSNTFSQSVRERDAVRALSRKQKAPGGWPDRRDPLWRVNFWDKDLLNPCATSFVFFLIKVSACYFCSQLWSMRASVSICWEYQMLLYVDICVLTSLAYYVVNTMQPHQF
jgi:hypothetical protein